MMIGQCTVSSPCGYRTYILIVICPREHHLLWQSPSCWVQMQMPLTTQNTTLSHWCMSLSFVPQCSKGRKIVGEWSLTSALSRAPQWESGLTCVNLKAHINKWAIRKSLTWRFLNPQSYRRCHLTSDHSSLGSVPSEMLSFHLGEDISTSQSTIMPLSLFSMIFFLRSIELLHRYRHSPNKVLNAPVSSYSVFMALILIYIRWLSTAIYHNLSFLKLPLLHMLPFFLSNFDISMVPGAMASGFKFDVCIACVVPLFCKYILSCHSMWHMSNCDKYHVILNLLSWVSCQCHCPLPLAPLPLGTLSLMQTELDLSDDALQESDYDGGSDSGSYLLWPFVPLVVSPQKRWQWSTFSDCTSSNHYYGSSVCFPYIYCTFSPAYNRF